MFVINLLLNRPDGQTEKLGIEPATAQSEPGLGLSLAKSNDYPKWKIWDLRIVAQIVGAIPKHYRSHGIRSQNILWSRINFSPTFLETVTFWPIKSFLLWTDLVCQQRMGTKFFSPNNSGAKNLIAPKIFEHKNHWWPTKFFLNPKVYRRPKSFYGSPNNLWFKQFHRAQRCY